MRNSQLRSDSDHPSLSVEERWMITSTILTLVVTAWAFGGRVDWAVPVFSSLVGLTALVAGWLCVRQGRWGVGWAYAPAALFALYVGVSLLNPSHLPVLGGAAGWVGRKEWIPWLPTTMDRDATLSGSVLWLCALVLGGSLWQARLSGRAVRVLLGWVLVNGLVLALAGVYFRYAFPRMILGCVPDLQGYAFSSFVYRNHWSAYVLLLMGVALGFAFSAIRRWLAGQGQLQAALPAVAVGLVLSITVTLPASRSGTVAVALFWLVALIALALRVLRHRPVTGQRWVRVPAWGLIGGLAVTVVLGGFAVQAGLSNTWDRQQQVMGNFDRDGVVDSRQWLIRDTATMALARPWWGWGMGTYSYVFPLYMGDYFRSKNGKIEQKVEHAHCDWLQLAAEAGGLGWLILVGPALWLGGKRLRSRGSLLAWSGLGVLAVATYAWVEFPLHNPAVLFLWVVMLAVG